MSKKKVGKKKAKKVGQAKSNTNRPKAGAKGQLMKLGTFDKAIEEQDTAACDFCNQQMTFAQYASHQCTGLGGLNPLQERLKKAKWKIPHELSAKGRKLTPKEMENVRRALVPDRKRERRKKLLVYLVLCAILFGGFLLGTYAQAKPQDLSWQWPTSNCDAEPMVQADLRQAEIAVSEAPMPMPSDTNGDCAEPNDPDAPATATVTPVDVNVTSITLNLQPGITYYARMRVSAYQDGNWSAWSDEIQFVVPFGKPGPPIFLTGP